MIRLSDDGMHIVLMGATHHGSVPLGAAVVLRTDPVKWTSPVSRAAVRLHQRVLENRHLKARGLLDA
jgi:hypothetical protein